MCSARSCARSISEDLERRDNKKTPMRNWEVGQAASQQGENDRFKTPVARFECNCEHILALMPPNVLWIVNLQLGSGPGHKKGLARGCAGSVSICTNIGILSLCVDALFAWHCLDISHAILSRPHKSRSPTRLRPSRVACER